MTCRPVEPSVLSPAGFNFWGLCVLFYTLMTCLSVSKTVIYFENLCTSEIARVVQDDCNRVVQWMESSKLIINQIKTKSMLLGSWQNLAKSPDFCMKLYSLRSRRLNVLTVRKKEECKGDTRRERKRLPESPKKMSPPPCFQLPGGCCVLCQKF